MRGRAGIATLLMLIAGACGGEPQAHVASAGGAPVGDGPVKIGPPYVAGGNRYVPADDRFYDAVGIASWYGNESGRTTANGERLDARAWSAAHPTLPLPSYVEVTALATGRTIVVRVNDRGPFARDRLIDLSQAAAKALGLAADGGGAVRVRRVFPPEAERAALREGQPGLSRLTASPQLLTSLRARLVEGGGRPVLLAAGPMPDPAALAADAAPALAPDVSRAADAAPATPPPIAPVPAPRPVRMPPASPPALPARVAPAAAPHSLAAKPAPPPLAVAGHGVFVQVGAFGDAAHAARLAATVGGRASSAGVLVRVRVGPFADDAAARGALAKLRAQGYGGAAIVHE